MTEQLQAFFNDPKIKQKYLKQIQQHYKLDEIVHGIYWENGRGCAVGCLIHDSDHKRFETELGLPEWLAHLIDFLFENLSNGKAKEFPVQFIKSVNVGANYDIMYNEFVLFLLQEICKLDKEQYPDISKTISTIINYHKEIVDTNDLDAVSDSDWSTAWSAAWSAAWSTAWSAARSAARSAAWSAARSAARSAAWSAAWSTAWSAARSAAIEKISEKLLELLKKYD